MSEEEEGAGGIEITDSVIMNSEVTSSEKSGFAPFLEATRQASDRSRFMIYLILVAVVASFGVYRSGRAPGWNSKRIAFYSKVSGCYKPGWEHSQDPDCAYIYRYRQELGVPLPKNFDKDTAEAVAKTYEKQRDEAIKARQEALTISVPILGAKFDINDLGMVSGAALMALLFMLYASAQRESQNLRIAMDKARTSTDLVLLESTQVFSSANHNNALAEIVTAVLYALPVLILAVIDRYNFVRRVNSIFLQGSLAFYMEYALKLLLTAATARGAYLCWHESRAINRQLDDLRTKETKLRAEEAKATQDKERERAQKQQGASLAHTPAQQNGTSQQPSVTN